MHDRGKLPGEPRPAGRSPHSPCKTALCNSKKEEKRKKHLWTNSPSLCQFSHSCSYDNTDTRSSCKLINTSCFLMKYKETADIRPYVAACARTRTPPAQRLGLRGESDAILSSVCFDPGKVRRRHVSSTAACKGNFYSFSLALLWIQSALH